VPPAFAASPRRELIFTFGREKDRSLSLGEFTTTLLVDSKYNLDGDAVNVKSTATKPNTLCLLFVFGRGVEAESLCHRMRQQTCKQAHTAFGVAGEEPCLFLH